MSADSSRSASVLIIESDDSIRRLIATALELAGFRTCSAKDGWPAGDTEHAVIVRDVNLHPPESERALEEVAAVAPELLRRTVVTTTAPAWAAKAIGAGRVFAVICKPFDLEELVSVVTRCANRSRPAHAWRGRREVEPDSGAPMKMESVRRFVTSVPSLQQVLSVPVTSLEEAALHAEMRRTIGALSATLDNAARVEKSRARVAVFRAASKVAARLASNSPSTTSWPVTGTGATRRDH